MKKLINNPRTVVREMLEGCFAKEVLPALKSQSLSKVREAAG